eukprot:3019598-Rhodomonas_salina.2
MLSTVRLSTTALPSDSEPTSMSYSTSRVGPPDDLRREFSKTLCKLTWLGNTSATSAIVSAKICLRVSVKSACESCSSSPIRTVTLRASGCDAGVVLGKPGVVCSPVVGAGVDEVVGASVVDEEVVGASVVDEEVVGASVVEELVVGPLGSSTLPL